MNEEVERLLRQTSQTRHQFLHVEIQTCLTGLQMGRFELEAGNRDVARREVSMVEKGTQVIRRFLADVPSPQKEELTTQLEAVEEKLSELKSSLDGRPPGEIPSVR